MSSRALVGLLTLLLLLGGCAGKPAPSSGSSASGSSSGTSGAAATQRIEVSIAKGKITGGGRIKVAMGSAVTLVVTSDVADEVHLHGYDIEKELEPGKPATLQFTANLGGVFEVELHKANVVLVHLQVE